MSVSSIGSRSQLAVQGLVDMRRQLDELQQQLGTGKKATSYAGLGLDASFAVGLRSQVSALEGYDQTVTTLSTRLALAQNALSRVDELARAVNTSLAQAATVAPNGQTAAQERARSDLDELVDLLNTRDADRHLFAGRSVDQAPVESAGKILDGDGVRAGLRQVVAERLQADVGASGLGRLVIAGTPAKVSLSEDVAGSPFGFKLAGATSDIAGAVVAGPSGTPAAVTVTLGANPGAGQSVIFAVRLPDGSSASVRLTATSSGTPAAGEFTIGASPAATASNLQAALAASLSRLAQTELPAASALSAAQDFFTIDAARSPLRVAGPPFDSATALTAGTAADTVFWYRGEMASDPPRTAAVARVDSSLSVSYGMRANEDGIRTLVQNIAAFAVTKFDPNGPDPAGGYAALTSRVGAALASAGGGQQQLNGIRSELASSQAAIAAARQRHEQTRSMLAGLLDQVEGVAPEQVGAQMLALQTRLQASLRTTAMLYQLSLVNFL